MRQHKIRAVHKTGTRTERKHEQYEHKTQENELQYLIIYVTAAAVARTTSCHSELDEFFLNSEHLFFRLVVEKTRVFVQ